MSNDFAQILDEKMKLIDEIKSNSHYFNNDFLDIEFSKIIEEIRLVGQPLKNGRLTSWTKDFFLDLQRHYAYLKPHLPQHVQDCVDEMIDLFNAYITMFDLETA